MDEEVFLRKLHDNPDDESARTEYFKWLEETGDDRAKYVRLMKKRALVQKELEKIDWELRWHPGITDAWLEIAFPLRIRSEAVGRCFTNPKPPSPPFVKVGDYVTPDKVVCLIEVMHTFNEVLAGVHGMISEILVSNGDAVEYNQVLFRVRRPPDPLDGW